MQTVSLTGEASHTLEVEAGVGNLYVGPRPQRKGVPQLIVEAGQSLRWAALDEIPQSGAYPWPRFLYYEGHDPGLFEYAINRRLEQLVWTPTQAMTVDMAAAQIDELRLKLEFALKVTLPGGVRRFQVQGRAGHLEVRPPVSSELSLSFSDCGDEGALAVVEGLTGVTSLDVNTNHRRPADARSVVKYSKLARLAINGPVEHASALEGLQGLKSLTFRQCYELSELPALSAWPRLERVMFVDVSQADGRRLKAQAKGLSLETAMFSKLRSPDWIEQNVGKPFRDWPTAQAKAGHRAVETFLEVRGRSRSAKKLKEAVAAYLTGFDKMFKAGFIETAEREEIGDVLFRQGRNVEEQAQLLALFDALRDF